MLVSNQKRIFKITSEQLVQSLLGFIKLTNLPEDAEIISVHYDPVDSTFNLKTASTEFETVPEGGTPKLNVSIFENI